MYKLSNSEVNTWLHCTRRYYYSYVLGLTPKAYSAPISNGLLIHKALEAYYLGKMDELTEDECREKSDQVFMDAISSMGINDELADIIKVKSLVDAYYEHYAVADSHRYEVFASEVKVNSPMTDEFSLAGTIDLVLRDKETGEMVGVDHKSSYNFWTDSQLSMSGQFVKYLYALRDRGFQTSSFMVNQLRTRELKTAKPSDLFRRAWVKPSDTRIRNIISQHLRVGNAIMAYRSAPTKENTVPIFDKFGCSNCMFLELCDSDNEGVDTRYMIEQNFKFNEDYGYNLESK